jgi:hypothetical protein
MRELARAGDRNAAIWAGLTSERTGPTLAVAITTASLQLEDGDSSGARQTLAWVAKRGSFAQAEAPLAVEAARQLKNAEDAPSALRVWRRVLGGLALSRDTRIAWLPVALEVARAAKDERQALSWDSEYKQLTAPPPSAVAADPGKK